jgi:hypothetical protein
MSNYYGDIERTIIETNVAFDSRIPLESDWVCEDCGCDQVQERAWVSINTRTEEGSCDDGEAYCPDCEEYVGIITRKEWQDIQAENSDDDEGV